MKLFWSVCQSFFVYSLVFSTTVCAAGDPTSCVITIKSVQLKNDRGEWITVIEPDHPVDLVRQEPGVSFFNNGRVPPDHYVNFKIVLLKEAKVSVARPGGPPQGFTSRLNLDQKSGAEPEIQGAKDFSRPLELKKASFIAVWFKLDLHGAILDPSEIADLPAIPMGNDLYFLPPAKVPEVTVTVGADTRTMKTDDIKLW